LLLNEISNIEKEIIDILIIGIMRALSITFVIFINVMFACQKEDPKPGEGVNYNEPPGKLRRTIGSYDTSGIHVFYAMDYLYNENQQMVKEVHYLDEAIPENIVMYYEQFFDEDGRLAERKHYAENVRKTGFELRSSTLYSYRNDKLIGEILYDPSSNVNAETEYLYTTLETYDLTVMRWSQPTNSTFAIDSSFFQNGLLRKNIYYQDGRLFRQYEYSYDDEGRLIEKWFLDSYYKANDSIGVEEKYIYNKLGQHVRTDVYDPWWGYAYRQSLLNEYY